MTMLLIALVLRMDFHVQYALESFPIVNHLVLSAGAEQKANVRPITGYYAGLTRIRPSRLLSAAVIFCLGLAHDPAAAPQTEPGQTFVAPRSEG
jgi:hypothetical protein